MFPRKALVQFPKVQPSADSLGEVEADVSFLYYIKGDVNGKPTRASEWLGTQLAEAIGLAAPAPCIIELQDGTTVWRHAGPIPRRSRPRDYTGLAVAA
jgi:hypothetical protein